MRLKYIHITAYKVFNDFDISFCHDDRVLDLMVLTGINGTGKTTLLKDVISGASAFDDNLKGSMTVLDNGKEETYTFPIPADNIAYKKVRSSIVFYPSESNDIASRQLKDEIIRYVDKLVYVEGKTSFEAYKNIQLLIDKVFPEFNLQVRFKGINENKELIFTDRNGVEFGIEGLSGGEQQVLAKIFPLFASNMKERIIVIDEPEESLHPLWQSRLIPVLRYFAENNDCQIILATHSPQIISSVYKEEIRILTRNEKGYVEVSECNEGSYGWTVDKVLEEIQSVKTLRVPEVETRLINLRDKIQRNLYDSTEFQKELNDLECLLGYSDRDLILIRMELLRKKKTKK